MAGLAGYMDESMAMSVGYGELIDAILDYCPDLTWPLSVRTYGRMRWDPQLKAILSAYTLPIRRATWQVDGTGCKDEVTQQIADDLNLPVLGADAEPSGVRGRGVDWHEHLRLALLDLTFGYMPFEMLWEQQTDGLMHLTELSERMPQTIEAVKIDPSNGQITSVMQMIRAGAEKPPMIPAQNLVWYSHDHEGAAWFGQSLLRASYSLWLMKDQALRVHGTSLRRFGLGILEVQAPPGATPQQVTAAQQYATSIKASDQMGAGLPSGFTSSLRGLTGSVPDAVAFITYLDQQMTRSTLASILDMATTTNGTQSLGTVIIDTFMLALQAIADEIAQIANDQIILPLVTANYGDTEPAPRIVCSDVGASHEADAETLGQLLVSGGITPDPALDAFLRGEYKLPARTDPWQSPTIAVKPPGADNPIHGLNEAIRVTAAAQSQQSDEQTTNRIAALFAAGLPAVVLAQMIVQTLAAVGVTAAAADAAFTLVGVPSVTAVLPLGPAARATAASEPLARAAYLLAAAQRIQVSLDGGASIGEALDTESRFYAQHLQAQANRKTTAAAVDDVADKQGSTVLGWQAHMDDRTTPDCAAANGTNFSVTQPPVIGWPGAVHPHCRCRAVPQIAGAPWIYDVGMPADQAAATG